VSADHWPATAAAPAPRSDQAGNASFFVARQMPDMETTFHEHEYLRRLSFGTPSCKCGYVDEQHCAQIQDTSKNYCCGLADLGERRYERNASTTLDSMLQKTLLVGGIVLGNRAITPIGQRTLDFSPGLFFPSIQSPISGCTLPVYPTVVKTIASKTKVSRPSFKSSGL
jgi:hypothetical protein